MTNECQHCFKCKACEMKLSPRENEILREVCNGRATKEIATKLHITEKTIKNHLSKMFDKLHVSTRTHLVIAALKQGLITLEEIELC